MEFTFPSFISYRPPLPFAAPVTQLILFHRGSSNSLSLTPTQQLFFPNAKTKEKAVKGFSSTECIWELDWTLANVAKWLLSCHFWPLLMWATFYSEDHLLPEIGSSLKPNNQVKLLQISDTHCRKWMFLYFWWNRLKMYFSYLNSRKRCILWFY